MKLTVIEAKVYVYLVRNKAPERLADIQESLSIEGDAGRQAVSRALRSLQTQGLVEVDQRHTTRANPMIPSTARVIMAPEQVLQGWDDDPARSIVEALVNDIQPK